MSEVDNKKVVCMLYEDGWGKGDLAAIDKAFAEKHVLHWNELTATDQHRTTSEVKAMVTAYRAAFPDLKVTINSMIAENDRVAVQVTFVGTHRGIYEIFKPTNKKGRFTDMQMLRFERGKIVEASLGSGGLRYFFAMLDGTLFTE